VDASDNLAERVLDQAGDAVIYADRLGTIRRWNRAAATLLGFAAEEALGQSLDLVIPDHLRASHWRGFEAAMATGALRLAGRPTLTRAAHKSGRKLYIEMTFALIVKDGAAEGSVAVAGDVTERVERERVASRTAQAQQGLARAGLKANLAVGETRSASRREVSFSIMRSSACRDFPMTPTSDNIPHTVEDRASRQSSERVLPAAALRALAEAAERSEKHQRERAPEVGGRGGEDPVRYGDWEVKGLAVDF
jgi:PAS domain S-box-containing protein